MDIIFALTRSCEELFQLCLQILDQFLLLTMHGESDLSCDYKEIMRRYCQFIAVLWGGWVTLIQGIEGGSLLLLFVLAVKNEGRIGCYEKGIVGKEQWNPKMLNPNGTYAGSSIEKVSKKKNFMPTAGFSFGRFISKRKPFAKCSQVKKIIIFF
jgi:hypothetical protein